VQRCCSPRDVSLKCRKRYLAGTSLVLRILPRPHRSRDCRAATTRCPRLAAGPYETRPWCVRCCGTDA
jgi:hypothetical protein